MSRIPALTPRQLLAALKRGGYTEARQSGSHLILEHASRRTVILPMHNREMSRALMKSIVKDAGYSEEEILGLL